MATTYAGRWGPEGLEYANGKPAASVSVAVRRPNGTLATLYTTALKSAPAPNPVQTDEYGNLSFYATPGEYLLDFFGVQMPTMVGVHPDDPSLGSGGGSTGPLAYTHDQDTPTTTMTIPHNMGFDPAGVECFHSDGSKHYPRIYYVVPRLQIRLDFHRNFRGLVRLS